MDEQRDAPSWRVTKKQPSPLIVRIECPEAVAGSLTPPDEAALAILMIPPKCRENGGLYEKRGSGRSGTSLTSSDCERYYFSGGCGIRTHGRFSYFST